MAFWCGSCAPPTTCSGTPVLEQVLDAQPQSVLSVQRSVTACNFAATSVECATWQVTHMPHHGALGSFGSHHILIQQPDTTA